MQKSAVALLCVIALAGSVTGQDAPGESSLIPDAGETASGAGSFISDFFTGAVDFMWSTWKDFLNFVVQDDSELKNPFAVTLTLIGFSGIIYAIFNRANDYINGGGTTFDVDDEFPGGIPAISIGLTLLFLASGKALPLVELFWNGTYWTFLLLIAGISLGALAFVGFGGGTAASITGIGGSIKLSRKSADLVDLKDELRNLERAGFFVSNNLVQRFTRLFGADDLRDAYTDYRRIPECVNGHLNPRSVGTSCNYCGTNTWNRRP